MRYCQLAAKITGGSLEAIGSVKNFFSQNSCSDAQLEQIVSALFVHLDERKVPVVPGSHRVDKIRLPTLSLSCMMYIGEICLIDDENPSQRLANTFVTSWPSLPRWLRILAQCAVDDTTVGTETRESVKRVVLRTICLYSGVKLLHAVLPFIPEVIPQVLKLWMLEITEPRLHYLHTYRGQHEDIPRIGAAVALLCCLEVLHSVNIQSNFMNPTHYLEFSPKIIASTALSHLKYTVDLKKPHGTAEDIEVDVGVILHLAKNDILCQELLSQRSLTNVIKVAAALTAETKRKTLPRGLPQCFQYIRKALEAGNGFTWAIEALDAQILVPLLRSSLWSLADVGEEGGEILSSNLPKYLVYESVVMTAARAIRKVRSLGIESQIAIGEPLKGRWEFFGRAVWHGLWLGGRVNSDDHIVSWLYGCGYEYLSKAFMYCILELNLVLPTA